MTEKREKRQAPSVAPASMTMANKDTISTQSSPSGRATHRWLVLALLFACVTLTMLISLLFMASDCEPTKMMKTIHSLPEHVSARSLMITGNIITTIAISITIACIGLALSIVYALVRPKRNEYFIPLTPFVLDLPAEEVTFPPLKGSYQVRGIYSAHQDATTTIIVSPGYHRTFFDVLAMCKHLWLAGHNVLAFEYYGHGSIVGVPITLGDREINDFLGAVTYARQRAPLAKIGALGYSMGGAVSIMGSAHTSEVLAVVSDSAFASHWSAIEMAIRQALHLPPHVLRRTMYLLSRLTDTLLAWRAGYHLHQVEPLREIARIAPRPVLLIHGLADTIVHPDDSVRLYEAAGKPKALWHLPGTEHIKGYFTDGAAYTTKVLAFFDRYLKQSPADYLKQPTVEEETDEEPADSALSEIKPAVPYFWQESSTYQSSYSSLPTNSQARRGSDILTQQFPTVNQDPVDLIVQMTDGSSIPAAWNTQHIAVLIDATVIQALLVPATMQLLGKWNWWFPRRSSFSSVPMVTAEQHSDHTNIPALPHLSAVPISQKAPPEKSKSASRLQQAAIEQRLMQIVAQTLELPSEQVRGTGDFFAYGGDSHSLNALLSEIEHQWHVRVEANDVFDHPVLFHLAVIIMQRKRQSEQEGIYV